MKNKFYILIFTFLAIFLTLSFFSKNAFAQEVTIGVTGSPAPVSVGKLQTCINSGKDLGTCAQEVIAYLHELNYDTGTGTDCTATSISCSITCGNGSIIVISRPGPTATPTPTKAIVACSGVCKPADAQGKTCSGGTYDYKDVGDDYCATQPNAKFDKYCMVCKPGPTATPSASITPTKPPTSTPPVSTPPVTAPPVTGTPPVTTPTATPGPTSTPAPTVTPTPSFDEETCKCVGLDTTSLSPGTAFTATAKGKVVGKDQEKSKLISFKFFLYKGQDTNSSLLPISEIPTSVDVDPAGSVTNYTAKWSATFPSDVEPGATYRIQAQKKCIPKSIGMAESNSVVLGTKTENKGFFASILSFINKLFGREERSVVKATPTPTAKPTVIASPTPVKSSSIASSGTNAPITLKTFSPAIIEEKSCSFITFHFDLKK